METGTHGAAPRDRKRLGIVVGGLAVVALGFAAWAVSALRCARLVASAQVTVVGPDGSPVAEALVVADWDTPFHQHHTGLGVSDASGAVPVDELRRAWSPFADFELRALLPGVRTAPVRLVADTKIAVPAVVPFAIQLCTADGAPLRVLAPEDASVVIEWDPQGGHRFVHPDPLGRCDFGFAVASVDLPVWCRVQGWEQRTIVHVPPVGSAPTPVALRLPADVHRIVGRMLGADGAPLHERFGIQGAGKHLRWPICAATCDADGRFEYLCGRLPEGGEVTFGRRNGQQLTVVLGDGDRPGTRTFGELRWALP